MKASPASLALTFALLLLAAGCLAPKPAPTPGATAAALASTAFTTPKILDPVRSGGEPVIFITPKGTLLIAAHPGFTHTKPPPGPEEIVPASGQSYLFRSTDGGATWTVITGQAPNAPRNDAFGVSDPDLAASEDGKTLVMADLSVASISTAASHDDAVTWPDATPLATSPKDNDVDRPWLAEAKGTFYLLYNGNNDAPGHWRFRSSTDGVNWNDLSSPGDGSYEGAIAVSPVDGSLYIGNGDKVWSSTDAGKTFASSKIPGVKPMTGITAQRPAVDANGTVYFAWSEFTSIFYAASHDHGATWGPAIDLTASLPGRVASAPGTHIWPWPAAGAAGKLAIVWVGTNETNADPSAVKGDWFVDVALVDAADTAHPTVFAEQVPGAKVTTGGICIDGTACETEGKDRRLGDFISDAIDAQGMLHIAYGTTTTGHSISSPAYVREVGGFALR
ncbi:MAG: sialidase family protein [Thermoplasmatota archaeon]